MSSTGFSIISRIVKFKTAHFGLRKPVARTHDEICDFLPRNLDQVFLDGLKIIKWCGVLHGRRSLPALAVRGMYEAWFRCQARFSSVYSTLDVNTITSNYATKIKLAAFVERGECTEATAFYSAALDMNRAENLRQVEELRLEIAGLQSHLDMVAFSNEQQARRTLLEMRLTQSSQQRFNPRTYDIAVASRPPISPLYPRFDLPHSSLQTDESDTIYEKADDQEDATQNNFF